eukprot:GEMP01054398.1.p1 GENE.GEMP01054398.1~~GEMP01054398.1.p1  ORF type:complete len:288 (+),score=69.99 GEMP01054398.1:71-934(+)
MDTSLDMSPMNRSRPHGTIPTKRQQKTVSFGVVDVLYYRADLPSMDMMQEVIRIGNKSHASRKVMDATKFADVARKIFTKERIDGSDQKPHIDSHGEYSAHNSPRSDHFSGPNSSRSECSHEGCAMSPSRYSAQSKNYYAPPSPSTKSTASTDYSMIALNSPRSAAHLSSSGSPSSQSSKHGAFHLPQLSSQQHHAPLHAQQLAMQQMHAQQTARQAQLDARQAQQDARQAQLDAWEAQQLRIAQQRAYQPPPHSTKSKPVPGEKVADPDFLFLTLAQQQYMRRLAH